MKRNIAGNNFSYFWFLLLGFFIIAVSGCSSETPSEPEIPSASITFQQGSNGYNGTSDAFVTSVDSSANHGSDHYLWVDITESAEFYLACLKFDLSYLLPGTEILSAYLTLYIAEIDGPFDASFWRFGGDWDENTITFSNMSGDNPVLFLERSIDTTETSIEIQLPAQMVQEWVNNPDINHGIVISEDSSGSANYVKFYSSDFTTGSFNPKHRITYREE